MNPAFQKTNLRDALRNTLVQKQELVRDYQSFAEAIDDHEISELYRNFAEEEAYGATTIKEYLQNLS